MTAQIMFLSVCKAPYFIYCEFIAITKVYFNLVLIRKLRPKLVITTELQTFYDNVLAPIIELRVQLRHHILPSLFGRFVYRLNILYIKLLFAVLQVFVH